MSLVANCLFFPKDNLIDSSDIAVGKKSLYFWYLHYWLFYLSTLYELTSPYLIKRIISAKTQFLTIRIERISWNFEFFSKWNSRWLKENKLQTPSLPIPTTNKWAFSKYRTHINRVMHYPAIANAQMHRSRVDAPRSASCGYLPLISPPSPNLLPFYCL